MYKSTRPWKVLKVAGLGERGKLLIMTKTRSASEALYPHQGPNVRSDSGFYYECNVYLCPVLMSRSRISCKTTPLGCLLLSCIYRSGCLSPVTIRRFQIPVLALWTPHT